MPTKLAGGAPALPVIIVNDGPNPKPALAVDASAKLL